VKTLFTHFRHNCLSVSLQKLRVRPLEATIFAVYCILQDRTCFSLSLSLSLSLSTLFLWDLSGLRNKYTMFNDDILNYKRHHNFISTMILRNVKHRMRGVKTLTSYNVVCFRVSKCSLTSIYNWRMVTFYYWNANQI